MKNIILKYLRHFPVDRFKNKLEKFIDLPKGDQIVEFSSGLTYNLNMKDHVMRQIYLKGIYEKNTIRHLTKLVKSSGTFVDVGANIGAYTIGLSKYFKDGKIISFEPNPRALNYLNKNIELNQLKNIRVEKVGLSDQSEEAILFTPSMTTASMNKHKSSDEQEVIKLITLDDYCNEKNITNIDLLKIDIEGHEIKCIEGAKDIINKSPNMVLVMEIDDNCLKVGRTKEETFQLVRALGFNAYLPKGFPFGLKKINHLPPNHRDNIIFIKSK